MQPSQDNRDHMVKKLEKGTYVTSIAHQQGQAKRKDLVQDKKGKHGTLHLFHEFQEQDQAPKKRKVSCKDKGMLQMQRKRSPYSSMPYSAKCNQDSNSWVKPNMKQVQNIKDNSEASKVKHRTCYTCRETGHLGKDCPKENVSYVEMQKTKYTSFYFK